MSKQHGQRKSNCTGAACCGGVVTRRNFVKLVGLGAVATLAPRLPVMAGPFTAADFEKLVPADKKLDPNWVKALYARGERTVYRGKELDLIGMPIGGIGTGQLYLGGDGKLWHWDIFNKHIGTGDGNYAHPPKPGSPLEQGFAVRIGGQTRTLDRAGFADIRFCGEYPLAFVEYQDPAAPVTVALEAFSPFIPLNADDSNLPATVLRFTVKNTSAAPVAAELVGWLENAVCLHNRTQSGLRRNDVVRGQAGTFLNCAVEVPQAAGAAAAPDVVFEDWNKETYAGWTVEGTAFGSGPIQRSAIPGYQGDVGGEGERLVNSHASAPGAEVAAKDGQTGKLTSQPFAIARNFITLWIGGGNHPDKTCVNVRIADKVVRSVTGQNDNRMSLQSMDVREFKGQQAVLEIVDDEKGGWGNIGVGRITFSDQPPVSGRLDDLFDYGTMGLALLDPQADDLALPRCTLPVAPAEGPAGVSLDQKLIGALGRKLALAPGQAATVTFVVAWHFPHDRIQNLPNVGPRHYAKRFNSAAEVAAYVAKNFAALAAQTKLWHDTWYDSTLPYWFLDRTFLNTSILATSTAHWFAASDRFWGWEGVGCCEGTCGHVWQYAHAMARVFPELERGLREQVDFGLALKPDGAIWFRAEHNDIPAIDAQAGTVLRALREHQMAADDAFLRRIWPGVKRALEWLIAKDANGDGLIESNQHNTLDTDWFGPVAWLSGLYVAALRAGDEMARELGDADFAKRCREIFETGQKNLVAQLYDGEYFINKPDPQHLNAVNSGSGCEIDQVMGQSWAWQVALGRTLPQKETLSALRSLWKYNFAPDVGPYRAVNKPGRWYAMPGEAGLLMCSFPRADWDYDKAKGQGGGAWAAMYFNECMTGFEYQAASHMVWEGLVQEGLAVTRAVHDRYHAARRNPWNEVECGDHYARAMASYGVFLAACGFEYHGPKGHIGFAPRLTPENFKAAFTSAEGWGTYEQKSEVRGQKSVIELKYGKLRLKTIALSAPGGQPPASVKVHLGGQALAATQAATDGRVLVTLAAAATLNAGQHLEVVLA